MFVKIDTDHARFKKIIRGKIKKELKKFMSQSEMIGKEGKKLVSIPIPQIDIPHFTYGQRQKGGVGQGDGEPGTPIGTDGEEGDGSGKAGQGKGDHILEVDVPLQELAELMGEELELPKIQPKGDDRILSKKVKYTGVNRSGPESLRHFRRTYRAALKRHLVTGTYNFEKPVIVPIREDRRYRTWKKVDEPQSKAVIIYMMDVSGSMGAEQKEIVRTEAFWLDTWIRSQYENVECRYIVHDAIAREVDQDTFYRTRESGGTIISSAYRLCLELIEKNYNPLEWNIYPFHFSDGDNWSSDDTQYCMKLILDHILPQSNAFFYGQVESPYGSGQFLRDIHDKFGDHEDVVTSKIGSKDEIYKSIKEFLGKGR